MQFRVVAALVVLGGGGGAGCGGHPARTVYAGPADIPLDAPVYRVLPGGTIATSSAAGYVVTAARGGAFRLVWTGDGDRPRRMFGSVWLQGEFLAFSPGCRGACPLQTDDYVSVPQPAVAGQRIDFDGFAAAAAPTLDGLDFVVDTEPVYFDLFVDGRRAAPELVAFPATDQGGARSSPRAVPFGLTSR